MCSSVFTEGDRAPLIEAWTGERAKMTKGRESPKRGAVANAGWARRRPVGPTPTLSVAHLRTVQGGRGECSLCLLCHRTARNALQAESSEPRETRGRRVTRLPADHHPSSCDQETKCVLVCTWRPNTLGLFA